MRIGAATKLWEGMPPGARRDLGRFLRDGKEDVARKRITTMREIADFTATCEPGTTDEEARGLWEAAEAAKEVARVKAEKAAKTAAAKAKREAEKAAEEAKAAAEAKAAEEAAATKAAAEAAAKAAEEARPPPPRPPKRRRRVKSVSSSPRPPVTNGVRPIECVGSGDVYYSSSAPHRIQLPA